MHRSQILFRFTGYLRVRSLNKIEIRQLNKKFRVNTNYSAALADSSFYLVGSMIISLLMNITMNKVGGASVIAKFHS